MDVIKLLPENVANQIAAGEVIQRPSSAVKELLENSIDAGASEVKLIVTDAGKSLVMVIDNGSGMSVADSKMAFERHATSKIRVADDLFSLKTKGFRGEALASIAAVAQVELITRQETDQVGTMIRIEGNKIMEQRECVCNKGTSISMKNLFFNIPARRHFLKSDTVELRHIIDEFQRVALAQPEVKMIMINGSEEIFNLPSANLKQRIGHIFGKKIDERLVSIREDIVGLKIGGYVCKPSGSKKNSSLQFFIINNRYIRNRYLHHAVVSAFEGLLREKQQPEYFICLEIDPKEIDINIHPTKTEIKFENEHTIYTLLRSAVKHSLGMFNVKETIDFTLDNSLELPYSYKDKEPEKPQIIVDKDFNPFKLDYDLGSSKKETNYAQKKSGSWEGLYTNLKDDIYQHLEKLPEHKTQQNLFESRLNFSDKGVSFILFENKYAVLSREGNIYFINISRAHQRVLYEKFLKEMNSANIVGERLLLAREVELNAVDRIEFNNKKELLEKIGFRLESNQGKYFITSVPSFLIEENYSEIFMDLLEDDSNENFGIDVFAKKMSKKLSAKTSELHNDAFIRQLIKDLFLCQDYLISPTGKKIYFVFSAKDIDNKLA